MNALKYVSTKPQSKVYKRGRFLSVCLVGNASGTIFGMVCDSFHQTPGIWIPVFAYVVF